jgi:quercetin dioxygenase-like cupin family protein
MITIDLARTALEERFDGVYVSFPLSSRDGTAASSLVYFELDPGAEVPTHQDSSEELLLCVEGKVEASLGDERGPLMTGELALIPAMVPHGVRNTGDVRARMLGCFAGSTTVSTFADFVAVIGAPVPIFVPREQETAVPA